MKLSRVQICGILIGILHLVGFAGFTTPAYAELFRTLVPFHLLTVFGLILYSHTHRNRGFWIFVAITYTAGYLIELLGVHTGLIFGSYSYGSTLGFKVAGIPLLIGVNWVIMVYSAGVFLREFNIPNRLIRSILGAALLTFVDFLIEPVAVKHDYWSWENFDIPIQNATGWFFFSFLMLFTFYNLRFSKTNPVGSILFVVQTLFFLALNIALD